MVRKDEEDKEEEAEEEGEEGEGGEEDAGETAGRDNEEGFGYALGFCLFVRGESGMPRNHSGNEQMLSTATGSILWWILSKKLSGDVS